MKRDQPTAIRAAALTVAALIMAAAIAWLSTLPIAHRNQAAAVAAARSASAAPASVGNVARVAPLGTAARTALVATARVRPLPVYSHPAAKSPFLRLPNPNFAGQPLALRVVGADRSWLRVYLPVRPNEGTGWIRASQVRVLSDPYRVRVDLGRHLLQVWKGGVLFERTRVAVGKPSTPTPTGHFYIVGLIRSTDPFYGPYAYGLSGHSDVLRSFGVGGLGRIGIHGTNRPWLLGKSVSHGCVRLRNSVITRLAKVLPLGTPVDIVR